MANYWSVVADAIAKWDLQEEAGTTAVDSVGTHDASLVGGFNFGSASVAGPRGWLPNGLAFDGLADHVPLPSANALSLGVEHTMALWMRLDGQPPWQEQCILEFGGTDQGVLLQVSSNHVHYVMNRSGVLSTASAPAPSSGDWVHLAAVHRGNLIEVFINGELAGSNTPSSPWVSPSSNEGALGAVNTGRLLSGSVSGLAAHLQGNVADVQIYRRALSADDIHELYSGPEPSLTLAPQLPGVVRAGEETGVSPGSWDPNENGQLVTTFVVQLSDDGMYSWQDLDWTLDQTALQLPRSVVGQFVRVSAAGANQGGASDRAYSTASQVQPIRWPASVCSGAVSGQRIEAGAVSLLGHQQMSQILPGGEAAT